MSLVHKKATNSRFDDIANTWKVVHELDREMFSDVLSTHQFRSLEF